MPDHVGLVSRHELGPLIGQLRRQHQLNLLGIEALAAAIHLEAEVWLSAPAPMLEAALHEHGRAVHRLSD